MGGEPGQQGLFLLALVKFSAHRTDYGVQTVTYKFTDKTPLNTAFGMFGLDMPGLPPTGIFYFRMEFNDHLYDTMRQRNVNGLIPSLAPQLRTSCARARRAMTRS